MSEIQIHVKPWGRWTWHYTVVAIPGGEYKYGTKFGRDRAIAKANRVAKRWNARMSSAIEYEWKAEK